MTLRLGLLVLVAVLVVPRGASAERGRRQPGLLAELEFREGSARMPDASGSQLGRVAAWANDHFDALIVIDGHADATGPAAGNVRLSMRRARLVRDQLVAIGVDPSQIIITAFGSEGRRHARVAVWGTDDTLESVIAKHRRARRLELPQPDTRTRDSDPRHARPPKPGKRR